jgi:phospholipid-binding lipoprotein MlaA
MTRATLIAATLVLAAAAPAGADDEGPRPDPLEGMNRGIFWFNDRLDRYFLEPIAVGWDFAVPGPVQDGIDNAFQNARFPIRFVNNLLQAKPLRALEEVGLFLLNSTLGMGGLIDAGSRVGLESHQEDFGQTLGVWGVPAGPYLVLPLLGPSSIRDTGGLAADSAMQVYPWFAPFVANAVLNATRVVNTRALLLEEVRDFRESCFDCYSSARNAYLSYRENQVRDRQEEPDEETGEPPGDDLYYLDEEEEP